ncbi:MAG: hypothetical protein J5I98_28450 [Phaeodactylibacter sp.]|nr:hypothetical protein [Phaeodactylibacter sp.]
MLGNGLFALEKVDQKRIDVCDSDDEGKGLEGDAHMRLKHAIQRLERLRREFLEGHVATVDDLMDAISEAEKDVPHRLLSGYAEEEVPPQ